jgi:predicted ATP-grasp superfamily ATP-dependent carboligase
MVCKNVAIVLGGGLTGLNVMRNLGENGVDVYCVVESLDEAIFSKYCRKYFIVPGIQENKTVLESFLSKMEKNLDGCSVLFPTTDLFSLRLSEVKDSLPNGYCALVPKLETAETLVEKRKFYQSLSNQRIPCPATFFPVSLEDVKGIYKELRYPVFIKPSISQIFAKNFARKGFVANSAEELLRYYRLVQRFRIDVVLQEIIPGSADNIYGIAGYFDRDSNPKALFAYHRIRSWPPDFGTSSLIESTTISNLAPMKDIVKGYLHKLGYYGIMEAEFKRDPRNGIFKLLEINARSWWQNSLPTKCGVNIVLRAYLEAIGKETVYTEEYETGVKWMFFLKDLWAVIKTSPMNLARWCTSLKDIKDWAYFSPDDVSPWIVSNILAISKVRARADGGQGLATSFLRDTKSDNPRVPSAWLRRHKQNRKDSEVCAKVLNKTGTNGTRQLAHKRNKTSKITRKRLLTNFQRRF